MAHQVERVAVLETVLVGHQVERVHLVAQQPQAMQIAIAVLTQYVCVPAGMVRGGQFMRAYNVRVALWCCEQMEWWCCVRVGPVCDFYLNASVEAMPIARSCKYTSFPVCKYVIEEAIEEASEPRLSPELSVLEVPAAMFGYRRRVVNAVLGGLIG